MKSLSLAAGLNETAIRDILKGRVKSPKYNTLFKIANALECEVNDLFSTGEPRTLNFINRNYKDLFIRAVSLVDEQLNRAHKTPNSNAKSLLYLNYYNALLKNEQL